jgi:predicted flavoprotein YhiN
VVFNASVRGEALSQHQAVFTLKIPKANITKRLLAYLGFKSNSLSSYTLTTKILRTRGFEEAKVSGGGILVHQFHPTFEAKTIP